MRTQSRREPSEKAEQFEPWIVPPVEALLDRRPESGRASVSAPRDDAQLLPILSTIISFLSTKSRRSPIYDHSLDGSANPLPAFECEEEVEQKRWTLSIGTSAVRFPTIRSSTGLSRRSWSAG